MKQEELDEGKRLINESHKWWRSTMPGFAKDDYYDEPINQLVKWFGKHALPELEKLVEGPAKPDKRQGVLPLTKARRKK